MALIVSTSRHLMKSITQYRFYTKSILRSDKYYYGDLFGMCYLSGFKIEPKLNSFDLWRKKEEKIRFINLWVAGDSYLGYDFVKNDSIFYGVKRYHYLKLNSLDIDTVSFVKDEKNILLIETVERYLRIFRDTNYVLDKLLISPKSNQSEKKTIKDVQNESTLGFVAIKIRHVIGGFFRLIKQTLYNPLINQNLEFNLFDYRIFTPIKEAKANFNYKFFKRISGEVAVSPDKKYLLDKTTVDASSGNSSFIPICEEEINSIIYSLNRVYEYYRLKGFDKVYFAIIPNPVTILYPQIGRYNELIPRIQNHHNLKMPIINIYDIFSQTKKQIYLNSDTHWNMDGFDMWLNEFNLKLLNNM